MTLGIGKVIDKVRKLLALAGNNPSQEEAECAMLKAQEILLSNGLHMSDVETKDEAKEAVEDAVKVGTRIFTWHDHLGNIVAENHRCKAYWNCYRNNECQSARKSSPV